MIAKGLDFPRVTLVGVISADTALNLPDFRASERTFQLISQVAGRSGRGPEPGEVIIQTFDPDQYAIQCAVNHDYAGFYEHEIAERREVKYPPFYSLVNVISRDVVRQTAEETLVKLVDAIKSRPMSEWKGIELMGPMPAVLTRIKGEYRFNLVLRASERSTLLFVLRQVLDAAPSIRKRLAVDVDPQSML
jgi:primosomal protein N' (replication factor Y)